MYFLIFIILNEEKLYEKIYDFLTLFIYANVLREKGETGKKDEWDEHRVIRPSKGEYHRWLSIRFVGQMQIEIFKNINWLASIYNPGGVSANFFFLQTIIKLYWMLQPCSLTFIVSNVKMDYELNYELMTACNLIIGEIKWNLNFHFFWIFWKF